MDRTLEVVNTYESDVRGYVRAFPTVFTKAQGSQIWNGEGKRYLDFFSGAGALNYGHNQPAIKQAMIDYLANDGLLHGLDMATEAKIAFITAFEEKILKPRSLSYKLQFTGPTGTNAVEAAFKLARLVTGRTKIISFTHAFHGVSLGSLNATSNSWFREVAGVSLGDSTFFPYDGYIEGLDSIALLTKMFDDSGSGVDKPAAIIVETIQGEGGINVASAKWLQALRKLTQERDILLIVDDIQAGCGRSGAFFSFEDAEIVPDMVTLSKSLSGSGLPMSLLLMKPEYDQWKPGQHNGTFRGNNLAFVSATAAITNFWEDENLVAGVRRKGQIIANKLQQLQQNHPALIAEVRGRGMFHGMEFSDPAAAKQAAEKCFADGLIIEISGAQGEVLKLLPALTITDSELGEGLDIISKSLSNL